MDFPYYVGFLEVRYGEVIIVFDYCSPEFASQFPAVQKFLFESQSSFTLNSDEEEFFDDTFYAFLCRHGDLVAFYVGLDNVHYPVAPTTLITEIIEAFSKHDFLSSSILENLDKTSKKFASTLLSTVCKSTFSVFSISISESQRSLPVSRTNSFYVEDPILEVQRDLKEIDTQLKELDEDYQLLQNRAINRQQEVNEAHKLHGLTSSVEASVLLNMAPDTLDELDKFHNLDKLQDQLGEIEIRLDNISLHVEGLSINNDAESKQQIFQEIRLLRDEIEEMKLLFTSSVDQMLKGANLMRDLLLQSDHRLNADSESLLLSKSLPMLQTKKSLRGWHYLICFSISVLVVGLIAALILLLVFLRP